MKNPIPADEQAVIWPLVGDRMLELGNKKNDRGVYKHYFESVGFTHVSIDWNGQDGALKFDLRRPIKGKPFDMVTNIGTTEHVNCQTSVWRNIHNLTKVDGVIASLTPMEGDWWWHGEYYPRFEFFEQFAELNGYEIEVLQVGLEFPYRNVYARLRKVEDKDFVMPNEDTIFYNKRRRPHARGMTPVELEQQRHA